LTFMSHSDWRLVKISPMPLPLIKAQSWSEKLPVIAAVDPKHSRHKHTGLDHKILSAAIDVAALLNVKAYALSKMRSEHRVASAELMDDFNIANKLQFLVEASPEYALASKERKLGVAIVVMGAIS
jgi:hypothetical protein